MTVSSQLTADLRKLVLRLEDDLRERLGQDEGNLSRWKFEHQGALDAQRTSSAWQAWRDDKITQSAVAWILTTVFVRFAEDNALVSPVWISGPGARRQEALDAQIVFFRSHPELTDREWLLEPVEYLKELPATADLVGNHSALWQVQPSGRMATEILEFWRQTDDAGLPSYDLADPELSTRFLGDLYQDLSDYAKKTFALLQTPEFVEEFILDQTLTPALAERSLEGFKLIDPTCGSGHFLLGAFARLTDEWAMHAPGLDARARVQKALDAVNGVDLNPFAVAIARFRLTVAALQSCNESSLELAPAFNFHLAAGDSLLHGGKQGRYGSVQGEVEISGFDADSAVSGFSYSSEDLELLKRILEPGQYDVVVGNPPYITVKDKTLNEAYRKRYTTCKGTYALTVPFMERFFGLAKHSGPSQPAGWTGQITSNSFMKREFGSKLIEEFLSRQDLRLVADTSGAYIPGHGTPTVIIVGRHQRPVGTAVRAVLGVRGEPGRPDVPAQGLVWQSISSNVDIPGHEDRWVSVTDLARATLSTHPWSLSGGGAATLLTQIDSAATKVLADLRVDIGSITLTRADNAYFSPIGTWKQRSISAEYIVPVVEGDVLRDFTAAAQTESLFPYDEEIRPFLSPAVERMLWRSKQDLIRRQEPNGYQTDIGLTWFEWSRLIRRRLAAPLVIGFAFVATHNHFVLDRDRRVFKQSAPVIKLPDGASEDEYLALLALLNSSVACFWLKENSHDKGNGGIGGGIASAGWERFYEFTGTTLKDFPLPEALSPDRGQSLDRLAQLLAVSTPEALFRNSVPTPRELGDAREEFESLRRKMIAQQEELDWEMYGLYGALDADLTYSGSDLPEVGLGERAFEIALARQIAGGSDDITWFERHGSVPITVIPDGWPEPYRQLIQRRLEIIESNPSIRLLEKPEFKRRWATDPWERQQARASRGWLLSRLEDRSLWFDRQDRPVARSVSQLADVVSRDNDFISVLFQWNGSRDIDVVKALTSLLIDEAVPYLAAQRLKESGLRKHDAWQQTWELQRKEDAGYDVGTIAAPPKYAPTDFRKASWWQARGKLDVPKERFILYPGAGRSTDQTLLLGWAGWNHVEQFLALAAIMDQLVADGAPDEQLIPLVAGMGEILPWVKQWHADIDPAYGVSMADFCAQQFEERAAQIDRSTDQLKAWRPTTPTRGRKTKVTQ